MTLFRNYSLVINEENCTVAETSFIRYEENSPISMAISKKKKKKKIAIVFFHFHHFKYIIIRSISYDCNHLYFNSLYFSFFFFFLIEKISYHIIHLNFHLDITRISYLSFNNIFTTNMAYSFSFFK